MKRKKNGRNEPCPCGSGKKYKKCCYGKTVFGKNHELGSTDPILPAREEIDYGTPALDDNFFRMNPVHEISAPRKLYSSLLMPEVEGLASDISNRFLDRGAKESMVIENTKYVSKLVDMMIKRVDSLNHERLKNKLLLQKETSIPLIIDELRKPTSSAFVELAVKVIHASDTDFSKEILEIVQQYRITPYAVSLLCMLLGFYGDVNSEKVLWDYYHYLREHFENETYSDGPLLGLVEMRDRKTNKQPFSATNAITMG